MWLELARVLATGGLPWVGGLETPVLLASPPRLDMTTCEVVLAQ